MDKTRKIYVCHANECQYNTQGSCQNDSESVTIAAYDGIAQCPNFTPADSGKKALAGQLLAEIKRLLLEIDGEPMEEESGDYELCTDANNTCFTCYAGSAYMHDFAIDERVTALIDAYNTILYGKPIKARIAG
ncbi:MAG: hypothetical protein H6Q67_388 [Firmicutes bacterium]|nr:hypothetical protein [Bacillota bacterium]